MRRNGDAESGRYRPFAAHRMSAGRLARPKERRLAGDQVLREKVQGWLDLRWSPQQIAQTLRLEFPHNPACHLVHESIYQAPVVVPVDPRPWSRTRRRPVSSSGRATLEICKLAAPHSMDRSAPEVVSSPGALGRVVGVTK